MAQDCNTGRGRQENMDACCVVGASKSCWSNSIPTRCRGRGRQKRPACTSSPRRGALEPSFPQYFRAGSLVGSCDPGTTQSLLVPNGLQSTICSFCLEWLYLNVATRCPIGLLGGIENRYVRHLKEEVSSLLSRSPQVHRRRRRRHHHHHHHHDRQAHLCGDSPESMLDGV